MRLSKTAKRRLTVLIAFMSKLPKAAAEHFDMGTWHEHTGYHEHVKAGEPIKKNDLLSCGTSACALGWAATVPSFQKAGLSTYMSAPFGSIRFAVKGEQLSPYDAASRFFDIDGEEARLFFSTKGPCYQAKTPQQWAKLAKRIVASKSR